MDAAELEKYSLEDLRALRGQIDKAISTFNDRRKREATAAAERAAREHGFSLTELTGARGGRGRKSAAAAQPSENVARYAHPEDARQTWSGRGRRPRWVTQQLEVGRSLEDLAI